MTKERRLWIWRTVLGIVSLLIAGSGAFAQLTFEEANVKFAPNPEDRNALGLGVLFVFAVLRDSSVAQSAGRSQDVADPQPRTKVT